MEIVTNGFMGYVNKNKVDVLKQILSTKAGRPISFGEAAEVGDALINFYETLAQENKDDVQCLT